MKMSVRMILLCLMVVLCMCMSGGSNLTVISNLEGVLTGEERANDEGPGAQERMDALVSALMRLPDEELARYNLTRVQGTVEAGSLQAGLLEKAWASRQQELKDIMAAVTKPAEHMQALLGLLDQDEEAVVRALVELERTVGDVDNARDFFVVGGWGPLTGLLRGSPQVSAHAAWTIGSLVKGSAQHQAMLLIASDEQVSVLRLLMEMLQSDHSECVKKALYALSCALRGNMDVQAEALTLGLAQELLRLAGEGWLKAWHLAGDMLEEAKYLHSEDFLLEHGPPDAQEVEAIRHSIAQMRVLGDVILEDLQAWREAAGSESADKAMTDAKHRFTCIAENLEGCTP